MRKRTSLRRWKARCAIGRMIPMTAIVDRRLERWFRFVPAVAVADWHRAVRR